MHAQLFRILAVCTGGMKILYSEICLWRKYKLERSPAPQLRTCTSKVVFTAHLKYVLQVKLVLQKGIWQGKFLEILTLSPQNDAFFDRELSIAIYAV